MQQSRSVKGLVSGRVQGVGFRYFVKSHAQAEQILGWVRNLPDGGVELAVEGGPAEIDSLRALLRAGPRGAVVTRLEELPIDEDAPHGQGFAVLAAAGHPRPPITAVTVACGIWSLLTAPVGAVSLARE